jgi:hypothetical protein
MKVAIDEQTIALFGPLDISVFRQSFVSTTIPLSLLRSLVPTSQKQNFTRRRDPTQNKIKRQLMPF